MALEEERDMALEGGIETPKKGDVLELLEDFSAWKKGTQCICLEYNEEPKCWKGSGGNLMSVRTDKVKSSDNWVLARRFKIVRRTAIATEGWTL